jgi:hypothetical protein
MTMANTDRKTKFARFNVKHIPIVIAACYRAVANDAAALPRRGIRTLDSIQRKTAGVHLCKPATKQPADLSSAPAGRGHADK